MSHHPSHSYPGVPHRDESASTNDPVDDPTEEQELHINDEVAIALRMRANYIETGDTKLSKAKVLELFKTWEPGGVGGGDAQVLAYCMRQAANLSEKDQRLVEILRKHADRVELDG